MFDNDTSAELPEHEDWIHNYAIPLLERRYGVKTTVLQAERTYIDYFYSRFKKGSKIGRIYGFPMLLGPWCNDRLKIRNWQKNAGEYMPVIGIAADEEKRIARKTAQLAALPLVEHGITEAAAFDVCRKAGLLSPAYDGGRERLGCWFCHNQRVGELRRLWKEHPALWDKLMTLDAVSPVTFKPDKTLRDFDSRFRREDGGG